MVEAVRSGESQRSVARRFGVSLLTVQRWVARAGSRALDRVDWSDRISGAPVPGNRTDPDLERLVIETRHRLHESILGECGAEAICRELRSTHPALTLPSVRTIGRILERQGVLDGKRRVRRPPPPPGWYLPPVAAHQAELDQYDLVEELKIKNGPLVDVLTGISLRGGLSMARGAEQRYTAQLVRQALLAHWQEVGLPGYVQFDNDTVFQGPHQHRDVISSVTRLCLGLGLIVVFTPPREVGFQAAIERFNGLWQSKVWRRYHHPSLRDLQERSDRYIAAHRSRNAQRQESAPVRHPFPTGRVIELTAVPQGTVVYIRRTTVTGQVDFLGRRFLVDPDWPRRLVRCEVNLTAHHIRFYRLRRKEPTVQPLIREMPYHLPKRSFQVSDTG